MAMTANSFMGLGPHGFHEVAYFEWGDPKARRVTICVHGLTRRGRDFDFLAEALSADGRVICVDLPGRGDSDWLAGPADYQPPTYVQDMAALIARLDVETVDWVGVSLGGLMGMMLAIQPKSPIRKLVLDDIGAYIGIDALKRIAGYVGTDPSFETLDALEAYMREVNAPYGPLTDAQWRHLVHHGARQNPETGRWHQHYDPRLGEPFKAGFSEPVDLWPVWDAIACPVLVLRGSQSDILSADTAAEMLQRKPSAQLIEFDGVGHAPMMMEDAQIQPVRAWLSA